MSSTIKAIEHHLTQRAGFGIRANPCSGGSKTRLATKLVAELQQRGPETLSGHAFRKLRLAFAPTPAVITASVPG